MTWTPHERCPLWTVGLMRPSPAGPANNPAAPPLVATTVDALLGVRL